MRSMDLICSPDETLKIQQEADNKVRITACWFEYTSNVILDQEQLKTLIAYLQSLEIKNGPND